MWRRGRGGGPTWKRRGVGVGRGGADHHAGWTESVAQSIIQRNNNSHNNKAKVVV
jgi:hypothetical protein